MKAEFAGAAIDLGQRPKVLGWVFTAVSAAPTVYFFIESRTVSDFVSAGIALTVAVMFGSFTAVAFVMLLLTQFMQGKSTGAAFAASVAAIVCGLVPPSLLVSFLVIDYLGR